MNQGHCDEGLGVLLTLRTLGGGVCRRLLDVLHGLDIVLTPVKLRHVVADSLELVGAERLYGLRGGACAGKRGGGALGLVFPPRSRRPHSNRWQGSRGFTWRATGSVVAFADGTGGGVQAVDMGVPAFEDEYEPAGDRASSLPGVGGSSSVRNEVASIFQLMISSS